MKLYRVLLLFLIPLLSSFYAHKYYLSVTDLVYNEEKQSVQMITRLFYDDLENVLQERYDEDIIVDASSDQELLDKYLAKYFTAKLKLTINGTPQKLQYIGKEYEDDYVVCYTEVQGVLSIEDFTVESTLLLDLFIDQKNMVHTDILGKKKSLLLQDGNVKALLKFSE